MIDKASIVLQALLLGLPVNLQGRSYLLEVDVLVTPVTRITLGSNEETVVMVNSDISLHYFLKSANELHDDYVMQLIMNIVLNKIKRMANDGKTIS